jgi:nitroreductase
MDALVCLNTRASAIRLVEPGPTAEQLDQILTAAIHAPDHGRVTPWRFIVMEKDARNRLGDAMVEALRAKGADATTLEKEAAKPLRAPTVVTVAAKIMPGKIPEVEQLLAAGAAAQNMLLAAHALGLGAVWKTGGAAYDDGVKHALGLAEEDHIVGFIYIGAQDKSPPLREVTLDGVVTRL